MKFLILGASGLVGGNCQKHFTEEGHEVLGTHFSFETDQTKFYNTLDSTDERNADVLGFKPDIIIHCGALTWVDYCEEHEDESYQKTVQSTLNAIELSRECGAKFVYLSTDYVFDGTKGLYKESDTVNPLGVYAKHKLASEQVVQASGLEHLICRITNVYGDETRGKNFIARLSENMRKAEEMELSLPVDQYATPVNAWDVARAVLTLIIHEKTGIYHFASTDYLNRIQLAERVMSYFGHEQVKLIPVTTEQLNQPAARPLLGGMNASKFNEEFPDFRWSNVDDYLKKLKKRYE